jgi:hypothetical protein
LQAVEEALSPLEFWGWWFDWLHLDLGGDYGVDGVEWFEGIHGGWCGKRLMKRQTLVLMMMEIYNAIVRQMVYLEVAAYPGTKKTA